MNGLDQLLILMGRTSTGHNLYFDIAGGGHTLVTGETRSGKSVFSYSVLAQLASVPEVRVVGIDPTTVLLSPFVARHPDPLLVVGSQPERFMQVMRAIHHDMENRLHRLTRMRVDKLSCFTFGLPLMVVVLEELPGIIRQLENHDACNGLKPADRLAPRFRGVFETIAAEAAKVGIRLICLAQRPDANILGGYAREQLTNRVAFRVSNAEGLRMMFGDASDEFCSAATTLEPGYGFFREPGPAGIVPFRADYIASYKSYASFVESCDLTLLSGLGVHEESSTTTSFKKSRDVNREA